MRRWLELSLLGLLGTGCAPLPEAHEYLPGVTLEDAVIGLDGITVNWFFLAATFLSPDNDFITPLLFSHFRLERQEAASGPWKVIAGRIPASARTFLDRDLESGLHYRYRITSYLDDGRSTSIESSDPVTGPPWSIHFNEPEGPKGGLPGSVHVHISKFEKGIGRVDVDHVQQVGDPIGWWEEPSSASPTFRHPVVLKNGRTVDLDFNCGATITGVAPAVIVLESPRCREITDLGDGSWIGCQRIVEKTSFVTHEVTYRDSSGLHESHFPKPIVNDQLCYRHRQDPNEPPRDTRLFEARILLDEADRLWKVDSTASIKAYRRLLREFGDLVIRFQVRNRVERRAAQEED